MLQLCSNMATNRRANPVASHSVQLWLVISVPKIASPMFSSCTFHSYPGALVARTYRNSCYILYYLGNSKGSFNNSFNDSCSLPSHRFTLSLPCLWRPLWDFSRTAHPVCANTSLSSGFWFPCSLFQLQLAPLSQTNTPLLQTNDLHSAKPVQLHQKALKIVTCLRFLA
jgi:hypothetical protein